MEKYGRAGQATDDERIRCMRFSPWITKATYTHSEDVIIIAFHCKNGLVQATHSNVTRTSLVLL